MEERPISSRLQELVQRAADERQAEQDRQGETVVTLRTRVDDLADRLVTGNDRLAEKIDATFALTASTVEILQRLADRVDSLERSLDDITMRLGSISWRMDEVRDSEGRLAHRIDESALALAEAMFATGHGRRPEDTGTDAAGDGYYPRSDIGLAVEDTPETPSERDHAEETRQDTLPPSGGPEERHLPSFAATAARFEPPSPVLTAVATPLAEESPAETDHPAPAAATPEPTQPTEPVQQPAPESHEQPYANVVDLPSSGREPASAQQPADDVAGGRPMWGPSGDFLGSRPAAAATGSTAPAAFEFPAEAGENSPRDADDEQQDFFDRWAPRADDTVVVQHAPDVPVTDSPPPEATEAVRGLGGPRSGSRFLREVSAARENQEQTGADAVPAADARASDDTVPPEWFASYFRNDARSTGAPPTPSDPSPGPVPLPGSRPAPGSA